ncbi:MAG: transcription-repair coupling factor [Pseudonocardiales bacterium]|nr:transcription-repair coupling factor [Pseudonocardiales bacterium]MBV9029894.1 transcription-repair coupling factor [Pseudonocardiales bacterium]
MPVATALPTTPAHLSGLLEAVLPEPSLRELVGRAGVPELELHGPPATRPLVAAALARAGHPVLAVTATDREAGELAAELADVLGAGMIAELPSWETLPHERLSPRADTVGRRLAVLRRLAHPEESGETSTGPLRVVVTGVRSLIQPILAGLGEIAPVRLRVGQVHDFDGVLSRLADLAYTRVDMVDRRGEFAVRGGIVDVFPPTADHPVRVEFWGEEVSEIRSFALADQRTLAPAAELDAPPCRELLLTEGVRAAAARLVGQAPAGPVAQLLEKVASGVPAEGMESLIPVLAGEELRLLTDVMPTGTHVLLADPERIRARAADLVRTGQEFLEASWMVAAGGGEAPVDIAALDLSASAYRDLGEVAEHALGTGLAWWTLSPLTTDAHGPLRLRIIPARSYHGDVTRAFADLRAHTATGGAAILVVPGAGTAQRACEQLRDAEVPVVHAVDGLFQPPDAGTVTVVRGTLEDGFAVPALGLAVLTEADVTGARGGTGSRELSRMPVRRRNAVDPLALRGGDHVVHEQHGIGRFLEMVERTVGGSTREYLLVEYAPSKRGHPGDRLYIPTDQLDQVSRYVGGELPTLNKLGGSDWAKTKGRARKAVKEIAAELVQLYAARQSSPGHAFGPDTPWQAELEDAFAYTETPDQLAAINEVKADMCRGVPMDRVVCGDVGYGKTEIAVRAAFKAVQDGKQVAVLVPTTLLAQQHLQTFSDRMHSFPVTVRGLSRFTHPGDASEVLRGLAEGSVDIVIGTHRLLQPGVRWKDLGLVVVDEEQRFGVEHKEHIKALRTAVDVLTMSATPIPRTLEMSLAGIREMSTILTPPEERHPVLTYVGAYDDKQVGAAIRRELLRDGQVFYVHNRVSSIDKAARAIRELVPEARVAVAHGQMNEDQLERTVAGFWEREHDVLVCTTIVETGLDISNANTLIVERGDLLGLAQLHQLRGRVGRGRERGYAYFLYPPETPLTETAHDRLSTIAQYAELGAGMAVAMKDLEIRGAGNILGGEQSGHIAGVGFDLYIRLVGEAVEAFRRVAGAGGTDGAPGPAPVRVELPVDAHLPHDYIPGERLRLEAYRKVAEAMDAETLNAITDELRDRYGALPPAVVTLLDVARFRQVCRAHGVAEVTLQGPRLRFAPVTLRDSQVVRLNRLYPQAAYRAAGQTLSVPRPSDGSGGIGAPPLRDRELLDWCTNLVTAVLGGVRG